MTRKTKRTLMIGGGVAAAGVVGYLVWKSRQPASTPAALPAGTPVTTLTNGQKYAFGALLPSGLLDQATLVTQLQAAGWSNVAITYFMGQGSMPSTALTPPGTGGYAATAVWNGTNGAPVPSGVVAVAAS
jgi:hypothetical protein